MNFIKNKDKLSVGAMQLKNREQTNWQTKKEAEKRTDRKIKESLKYNKITILNIESRHLKWNLHKQKLFVFCWVISQKDKKNSNP